MFFMNYIVNSTVITYSLEIYYTYYIKTVIVFKLLFLMSFISISLKWKNIINLLLSLELFMLLMMFFVFSLFKDYSSFFLIIIIIISEAVLGLSLLIMSIRFFGNDYSMNYYW